MSDNRSQVDIRTLEQQNENLKGALISAKGIISCMEQRLAEAEQAHRVCRAHLEKAESRRDAVEAKLAAAEEDTARMDWLEGEIEREKEYLDRKRDYQSALFRQNMLITRAAIDAVRKEGKP